MKTYFVDMSNEKESITDALGRLMEYAYFLEEETGRRNNSFVDQILHEDSIKYKEEDI